MTRHLTTREFINEHVGEVDVLLGYGTFGEAWLLKDGSVVKITSALYEESCVEHLFKMQEKDPKKIQRIFSIDL